MSLMLALACWASSNILIFRSSLLSATVIRR
jgi:hypothetical protein